MRLRAAVLYWRRVLCCRGHWFGCATHSLFGPFVCIHIHPNPMCVECARCCCYYHRHRRRRRHRNRYCCCCCRLSPPSCPVANRPNLLFHNINTYTSFTAGSCAVNGVYMESTTRLLFGRGRIAITPHTTSYPLSSYNYDNTHTQRHQIACGAGKALKKKPWNKWRARIVYIFVYILYTHNLHTFVYMVKCLSSILFVSYCIVHYTYIVCICVYLIFVYACVYAFLCDVHDMRWSRWQAASVALVCAFCTKTERETRTPPIAWRKWHGKWLYHTHKISFVYCFILYYENTEMRNGIDGWHRRNKPPGDSLTPHTITADK